jgi:hypothetical protein
MNNKKLAGLAILAGGLEHIGAVLGFSVLSLPLINSVSTLVQLIAGVLIAQVGAKKSGLM